MLGRPLRPCLFVIASLAAACGSRSNLQAASGPPQEASSSTGDTTSGTPGGSGGGGGDGGAAAGGAGGALADCSVLEAAGPPALLDGGFGQHERHSVWTLSSEDGAQATLVTSRQPTEGPPGVFPPISVVHTTLEPWVTFPSGGILGPTHFADAEGGATFAAARAPKDRFALLFADALPPDGGLLFSNAFVPFESSPPAAVLVDGTAGEALFAAEGANGHLLGIQSSGAVGGGQAFLAQLVLAGEDGSLVGPTSLGCASGQMHGDAVRAGTGWLVALSTGGSLGGADCLDPGLSWPDEVQIAVTNGVEYTATGSIGAPGGATDVKMAASPGGAWVVLGTPPGQVVSGMFLGARIDAGGKVISTFPIGGGGDPSGEIPQNGTLAAAGVGDYLAVAWIDYGGDKGPFLSVKLFDPEGNPAGHLEKFPNNTFSGAPALLGSPSTPSLLVAWSETPDQGFGDGDKVRAMRIDCVGP